MRACDDEYEYQRVRRDQSSLATTSSAGCAASRRDAWDAMREHRVVFDLAPFEHFTRVFYGSPSSLSTRVGGNAFTQEGGLESRRRTVIVAASKVTTLQLPGSDSARTNRGYDLLRNNVHRGRRKNTVFDTLGGRWAVATLKTRPLCNKACKDGIFTRLLHLGYCLNRIGLLSVQEIQKGSAVRDNAFTLAMTQHLFGLERYERYDNAADVVENEQTLVVETMCASVSETIKRRDASSSAIIAIERAILLARAIARTAKFAPVQPVGSAEDARLAREMNKQKAKYGEHLVRGLRQKISQLRGESIQSQSTSKKPPRHQQATQQVADRPLRKRRSPSRLANVSARKRARRKSREPLVLKLKEPKVVIPSGVKRATAFGRDITNVTSEKTKRVVQSVSKAAAGFVRRQMSVKRSR